MFPVRGKIEDPFQVSLREQASGTEKQFPGCQKLPARITGSIQMAS